MIGIPGIRTAEPATTRRPEGTRPDVARSDAPYAKPQRSKATPSDRTRPDAPQTATTRTAPSRAGSERSDAPRAGSARSDAPRSAAASRSAAPRASMDRTDAVQGEFADAGPVDTTKPSATPPEFAAMLAQLAGSPLPVRDALPQPKPNDGVSLVDRLVDGELNETLATTGETSDALRYGMLTVTPAPQPARSLPAVATAGPAPVPERAPLRVNDAVNDAVSDALRHGIFPRPQQTTAAERLASTPQREIVDDPTQALLSRIATQRGSSLEQLLALGDTRGADARLALDAILGKAGTAAGLRLAAQREALGFGNAVDGATGMMDWEGGTTNADIATAMDTHGHAQAQIHAAQAMAAALDLSAADPTTPVKQLDGVAPELRARVERVIDRMKQEFGHDVTVVESVRSQERQDLLFEQGRSRPGQVVTWTRDSAHTRGEAVDVVIDGRWDNAEGFARLQRIAREEGLRTLGMDDPGHLELLRNGAPGTKASIGTPLMDAYPKARSEPLPQQATIAGVAQVAGVARVADVAGTAEPVNTAASNPNRQAQLSAYTAQQNAGQQGEQQSGGSFQRSASDEGGQPGTRARKVGPASREMSTDELNSMHPNSMAAGALGGVERVINTTPTPAAGSAQAERVSDVQQLRADAPAGPLTRMTLNVDGANGLQERVTVDLRGNTVDTVITTNAANVDTLRMRSGELQDALLRHGLDGESVTVRAASTSSDSADAIRAMAGSRDAMKLGAAPASTSGEGANANQQRDRTPSRDTDAQDDARRQQANRTREDRQHDGQPRGRRNPFTGTE